MSLLTVLAAISTIALTLSILVFHRQRIYFKSALTWMRSAEEIQNEIISTIEHMNQTNINNANQTTDNFTIICDRLNLIDSDKTETTLTTEGLASEQSFEVAKTKTLLVDLSREQIEQSYLDLLKYQYRYKNMTDKIIKGKTFSGFSDIQN
jgi:hypothetical protein